MSEYAPQIAVGHSHPSTKLFYIWGDDSYHPERLGREIEDFVGNEKQISDKTSAMYTQKYETRFDRIDYIRKITYNDGDIIKRWKPLTNNTEIRLSDSYV